MKRTICQILIFSLSVFSIASSATNIIPTGDNNNILYYKIGGAGDYRMPPVHNREAIKLRAGADLGLGYQCGAFDPSVAIQNSMNNLQNSAGNLTQNIVANATGSIAQMPMYFLAQANPTLYNLLNNSLFDANTTLGASVKSCQEIKNQMAKGGNPYQDWATLSVGDAWKKELSLTAENGKDINESKKDVDEKGGDDGVAWVQGKSTSTGLRAGGKGQPVVHVIADTVKAGYNAMLNRELTSDAVAPSSSGLAEKFPTPKSAQDWATNVLGDQDITTCTDSSCVNAQGGMAGRGLLSYVSSCDAENNNDCVTTIREKLGKLVVGNTPITKENLLAVSADELVISPKVIESIRLMNRSQQGILTNKLAQEVAIQRLIDKALTVRSFLQTGSQVPVIATNEPAQKIVKYAMRQLDTQMQSISFEADMRKKLMSNTVSSLMDYSTATKQEALGLKPIHESAPMMTKGAISSEGKP